MGYYTIPYYYTEVPGAAQEKKFSIAAFFSKCDQIRRKLKNLMENFISCAMRLIKKLSSKYIKIVS